MAEEGGNPGIEAAGGFRVIAENKQRSDDGPVDPGAAEGFLGIIADQDAQEGKHPFAEHLHVADQRHQCRVRMRVFEDKYLLRQGREPQQQADGDKAGNERCEDGGEFREEFLNTAGLLALQRLFLFGGDIGQRWRIRRGLFQ